MAVQLTPQDQEKLQGKHGPAVEMAMSILVQMAEVYQTDRLLDITGAHIDSTLYMGDATLEYAERLADMGAKVAVPTTLNVTGVDEQGYQEWPVPPEWAEKARRQMATYQSMGTIPTWTCAPYQSQYRPQFGQQIAWGESNAIAFANSVIGARTERYPDLLDICAAITARVPATGLHLTQNRAGQILFDLEEVAIDVQNHPSFYPVLGSLIGKIAGGQIPVLEGIQTTPAEDELKALGAAAASSGAVALFHIVGITPEAPTTEAAFQGREPQQVVSLSTNDLRSAWRELSTRKDNQLDMVAVGCPHFSLTEFRKLCSLVNRKRRHQAVPFVITTSRSMMDQAQQEGLLEPLRAFGVKFTRDTCILTTPMLPASVTRLMTNSGKYAYYAPGMLNTEVVFGTLSECVESAVAGKVVRSPHLWRDSNEKR